MFTESQIQELKKILQTPKKIVVIPHKNPDGDAIGSTVALAQILIKMGHKAEVVSPNDFPKFLKFMPYAKTVFNSEFNPQGAEIKIKNAEIIFLLDFNSLDRIDELGTAVEKSRGLKILIDHHQQPDDFDFVYSDTEMPATCQMIYHLAEQMNWTEFIDEDIATCLYTGLLTDTGNFRFPSVKASTLEVAAQLVRKGALPYKIQDEIFDTATEARFKLLSRFLDNMQLFPEYKTALFTLSREELLSNGFQKGDTDAFVNYGLNLKGYVFSVFMAEDTQKDFVKISFRSKEDFDVSELARTHFSGGGHINAAGGRSELSLEETVKKFIDLLPNYAEKLKNTLA
ncbi:DHH family phosphoesterase [Ornithobacterium rhinotracheale]|uniref:DHH family phosphoesterase n=1 Tax=Ornithobacterium rhinotracheale TaxID=28251 RepID=UPI001FF14B4B|nr:bifunctional oligoribonuclease/PAP phosphatase NrnA [Ornithobacterium rhinotracheale]MCK0206288.1 bifunctional oligoribonuclease/PAP phosphatase NrnA [Ornithobacterium rhinotracheale]